MKNALFTILYFLLIFAGLQAECQPVDSICERKVLYDQEGRALGWYMPDVPGAVYARVVKLSSEFLLHTPIEPKTGLPMYLVTCCYLGPQMSPDHSFVARRWLHNPACVFAGSVQSLAVEYRAYSGDDRFIPLVQGMLDYQLEHGTTPGDFIWPYVPYASADPFVKEYQGATEWGGKRGEGLYGIEPDKVGELGYGYIRFYEITGEQKYRDAAIHCADALAKNIRIIQAKKSHAENGGVEVRQSPWPFRVNACTGEVKDEYSSNVLEPVKLLRELVRIKARIKLPEDKASLYQKAADEAWRWLFSTEGPLETFIWNGYFEDVESDPSLTNRVEITPVELAKYLSEHPDQDKNVDIHVPALLYYAVSAFKTEGMDAMNEQLWCYRPMGSHTSRYGSACALWYEHSGNEWFKDQAYRFLNLAAYMTRDNGVVSTGPDYQGSWFSDGYSDYIRHFLDALAAVPEWAPAGENHLLRSSSVVQSIHYQKSKIDYTTFDEQSTEKFRLTAKPAKIIVGSKEIKEALTAGKEGWNWKKLEKGGVLIIRHEQGNSVTIFIK